VSVTQENASTPATTAMKSFEIVFILVLLFLSVLFY